MARLKITYGPEKLRVEGHTILDRWRQKEALIKAVRKVVDGADVVSSRVRHAYSKWSKRTVIVYDVEDNLCKLLRQTLKNRGDKVLVSHMAKGEYEKAAERLNTKERRKEEEKRRRKKRKRLTEEAEKLNPIVNCVFRNLNCHVFYRGVKIHKTYHNFWMDKYECPDTYHGDPCLRMRYLLFKRIEEVLDKSRDFAGSISEILQEHLDEVQSGEFGADDLNAYLSVTNPDNNKG